MTVKMARNKKSVLTVCKNCADTALMCVDSPTYSTLVQSCVLILAMKHLSECNKAMKVFQTV